MITKNKITNEKEISYIINLSVDSQNVGTIKMQIYHNDFDVNSIIENFVIAVNTKNSGLAVIGSVVATERTAVEFNDIIDLLENFVNEMNIRKKEMKELLNTKLEADYSTFGLSPYVFICDEYASFASVLASQEKKIRDKVKSLLYSIILQGRQLGFFVFLILQKSDATLIDTALRENIPLKLVLGNSEQQTYVTTFGTGVEILNRNFSVSEGVFTEPRLAPEPKLVQCPYCDFDILSACKLSPRDVITGAPENNK